MVDQADFPLGEWCDHMVRCVEEGPLVLSNLMYDLQNDYVSRELIRLFLRRVAVRWKETGPHPDGVISDDDDPSIVVFEEIRRDIDKELEIDCQGEPALTCDIGCSSIMPVLEFWRNIRADVTSFSYPPSEKNLEILEEQESLEGVLEHTASMPPINPSRPGKHVQWVTPTTEISALRKTCLKHPSEYEEGRANYAEDTSRLASELRTRLGLIHHIRASHRDPHYLEVCYPENFFAEDVPAEGRRLAAPTFFDGGPSRVYRSKHGNDGWGRTVDLKEAVDGLPEAVHLRISLHRGFRIRRVGRPDRAEVNIVWRRLAENAPRTWEPADVAELEALCSEV